MVRDDTLWKLAYDGHERAVSRYQRLFSQDAFNAAVGNNNPGMAIALSDDALALCGCPYRKISAREWREIDLAFLRLFTV